MNRKGIGAAVALVAVLIAVGIRQHRSRTAGDTPGGGRAANGGEAPISALAPGRVGGVSPADPSGRGRRSGAVARDWGALRAQPPISLPGGATARVALEMESVPVSSGLLVYCLVEGMTAQLSSEGSDAVLGPLECELVPPGARRAEARSKVKLLTELPPEGDALFARSIAIREEGGHRVLIRLPGADEVVADLRVEGTAEAYHAWTPFAPSDGPDRLREGVEGEPFVAERDLAVSGSGPALPKYDGVRPVHWQSEGAAPPADGQSLPRLIPRDPDGSLQIKFGGDGFILNSADPIPINSIDRHLLARWWVNGKPYSPHHQEEFPVRGGRVDLASSVRVHMQFDPERIGAKPGDRIGLQVLHVPGGWEYGSDVEALQELMMVSEKPPVTRLSERIEFVAW